MALLAPLALDPSPDTDGARAMFAIFIVAPVALAYLAVGVPVVFVFYRKRSLTLGKLLGWGVAGAFFVGAALGILFGDLASAAFLGMIAALAAFVMWLVFWWIG